MHSVTQTVTHSIVTTTTTSGNVEPSSTQIDGDDCHWDT